ncbi:STAS domain-containing protein [Candidatus Viadribacter manganicus]|uniref:MlaB-like STAS domain-containing protein n=1 Tax=Candidatus Viadribacter manganicus TaxID=1759059 RepID=A0A1B1AGK1_9PROT|nr:STAS domain-containing protein [Candidatus Viadribacter manganicus]ANP45680.1 hypothetical protein ATE48_06965 [Candidatus Viadribacter manganicus]
MARVELGPVLDLRAAAPLYAELASFKGQELVIDASCVERMGGLCVQILLAAQQSWKRDGLAWSVVDPSAAFSESATLMACSELLWREAA